MVLYVGRLAPEKNLPALVAAFEAMRARARRARLVLVGDGPDSAAFAARHPAFVCAGMRVGEDLAAHYASGDIFLFPSLTETYGNVTVEAMASGLAVVAYDYAAAAEHLRDGVSGLLADYDNLGEFTRCAAKLVTDPVQIRRFGARARATALGLDWERVVQQLEAVLLTVVEVAAAERDPAALKHPPAHGAAAPQRHQRAGTERELCRHRPGFPHQRDGVAVLGQPVEERSVDAGEAFEAIECPAAANTSA